MDNIYVCDVSVLNVSSSLERKNNAIRDAYQAMKTSVDQLLDSWKSSAADEGRSSFEELNQKYPNKRYELMNDFVVYLRTDVSTGYKSTEKKNLTLSRLIK